MPIIKSAEFEKLDPTRLEEEAVELRWKGVWKRDGDIPAEDAVRLLIEVRERTAVIEAEALGMGLRGIGEGRRTPRRHQRFVVYALFAFAGLGAVVALVLSLFGVG